MRGVNYKDLVKNMTEAYFTYLLSITWKKFLEHRNFKNGSHMRDKIIRRTHFRHFVRKSVSIANML